MLQPMIRRLCLEIIEPGNIIHIGSDDVSLIADIRRTVIRGDVCLIVI